MKTKQLVAMAALALLVALPARAAEVVSSNIVGYEKITLTPGLNMIGNQFLAVGGTSFQNINQMFKDSSQMNSGEDDGHADSILKWTGSGYGDVYYYDDLDIAWENVEAVGTISTDTFMPGEGFWYKNIGDANVDTTFAGEVPTNLTFSVTIKPGLNFVSNPYPMAICPNGNYFEVEGAVMGEDDGHADSILMWTGSGYGNVFYYDDLDEAWENVESPGTILDDTILEPLKGFWYKHLGDGGTLTFKRPYTIGQ